MLTYDSKHFNLSYPRPGDEYLHGTWLFIWDKVDQTRQFGLPNDNLMHDSENSYLNLLGILIKKANLGSNICFLLLGPN